MEIMEWHGRYVYLYYMNNSGCSLLTSKNGNMVSISHLVNHIQYLQNISYKDSTRDGGPVEAQLGLSSW